MYKIDLVGDLDGVGWSRISYDDRSPPPRLAWTAVLVFVCELDESSADLWYRHQEGQGVREGLLARKGRVAKAD